MYMAHVVFMSVVVTVWESVGMLVVQSPLLKVVLFSIAVLMYVCVKDGMDVVFFV